MLFLHLVPKNWLSRMVGRAVRRRWPFSIHVRIRDAFIRRFRVDVSEAERPLTDYPTLGEFFVRRLRPGARPLGASELVSPVDGLCTERGPLASGSDPELAQIKGIRYSLRSLMGKDWDPVAYAGGAFLTLYLSPRDYHRVHVPAGGEVLRVRHIAGALWPVNQGSVERLPDLFVRNDRMLVEMACGAGRILVALIGATNVGRITLPFCPLLIGNSGSGIRDWTPSEPLRLGKGNELGCFEMGSTVVLVLDAGWARRLLPVFSGGEPTPVRMGMDLGA